MQKTKNQFRQTNSKKYFMEINVKKINEDNNKATLTNIGQANQTQ